MDRRSDANLLLVRSRSWYSGGAWQLQQIHQQCLQRRADCLFRELVYQYVRGIRDILGGRLYGARAAKTGRRSGCFWTGVGFSRLSIRCSPTAGCPALVVPVLLHVATHRTRFPILYNGGLRYGYGTLLNNRKRTKSYIFCLDISTL